MCKDARFRCLWFVVSLGFATAPSISWAQAIDSPFPLLERTGPSASAGPAQRVADRPSIPDANVLRVAPAEIVPHATTAGAAATAAPTSDGTKAAKLTKEDILQRIDLLQREKDLDEATRTELTKRLQKANEVLLQADEAAARTNQYLVEIKTAPKAAEEAAAQLAIPLAETCTEPPLEDELPKLEQELSQLQSRLAAAREDLSKREAEVKRRGERKAELAKLAADFTQKIEEVRQQRAVPAAKEEQTTVTLVSQTEWEAREILLARQLELAKVESQRIDARVQLAPLQRDLAKRSVSMLEKEIDTWQRALAERRKQDSIEQAQQARRQLQNAHPALKQLAERNGELVDKLQTVRASIERVAEESRALNKQLVQVSTDFDRLKERLDVARMTRTNGILLRKQRADLENVTAPHNQLRFIEAEMPNVQLALIECEDERSTLGDADSLAAYVDSKLPSTISETDRQTVQRMAAELFAMKRDLLDKSIYDYNSYIKELSELEFSSRQLLDKTEAFTAFIDQNVLWIRSSEPLGPQDLQRAANGFLHLVDARLWLSLSEKTFAGLWRQPLQGGAVLLFVLLLFVLRRRLWRRLESLCVVDSGTTTLHFLPTLEALGLVMVVSSVWPCLMWCAGWWLESSYDLDEFSSAVAAGLQRGALFLLMFQLVRNATAAGGIGETHFDWYPSGTKVVRDNLRWFGTLGIPIAFAVTVVGELDDGQRNDALGRVAFIAGMVITATAMHQVFRRQKGMFHEALARTPQGWLNRMRIGSYLTTTGTPCALAVLAAAGYYYSARQLAIRFELTMLVALGLGLAHGVATRWFLVKRRNLAIKQARERRIAQGDQTSETKPAPPATNLSTIQSQLQVLLRYAVVLAVLVVAWYVWSDVLPALRIFDRFVLWTSNETPTTLTHGLLALVFVVGTFVMGKNLPALLQITVLERLPIDHGGRNAATIIFRYLVYLTGLCLVARTVNISWSSVHWLAAAMTVGLGFGLQEIFANLVSGLIILFERPIRAGDLVTVNGVTGTVTRMQIRATTITDADRRELIVPNKKFITEDVINWTLTDPTSRVTIEVGVAYGSDTALVHSLLMKVAQEHPLIMTDPAPMAIFRRFGESTLDFALFVFIQSREVYGIVLHDLHTAIEREFRQANVEIAFPQRDVNIRSISSNAVPILTELSKTRAA